MKIGNKELKKGAVLAPMAGVTDRAFREICKSYGASCTITEMVSAKAVDYGNKKTKTIYITEKSDVPVGIQIFGSHAPTMARVVRDVFNKLDFDFIDINMGCPVNKIVKNGEGSALMLDDLNSYNIVKDIVSVSNKPVSVKIRLGFTKDKIKADKFAKILEEAGASFISVHGRTRDMFYSGEAMYEEIAKIKENINIPVIANGDIFSPEKAKKVLEITGCDSIMVGRGALGRPWIFAQIRDFLETGYYRKDPEISERAKIILDQYERMKLYKPEHIALLEMRKHSLWYLKGMPDMAKIKNAINSCAADGEFTDIIKSLF